MKILVLHNAYQHRGGEDVVVEAEVAMLAGAGHDVHLELVSNDEIKGVASKLKVLVETEYSVHRERWMGELISRVRPDVVHVHNFFPLLTPAVHAAASNSGVAVVQTLHNYRLICANGLLLRQGSVCEKCVTGTRVWGAVHRCYRGSVVGSVAVTRMQRRGFSSGIWQNKVDRFIALTEFGRRKFVDAGLPAHKVVVKGNFTSPISQGVGPRSGALFVGRLSQEKGLDILLDAWKQMPDYPLTIVGTGPIAARLRANAPPNVNFVGAVPKATVEEYMRRAACLIVPSIWYETFGLVVVEAFAAGLPVVASNIGALAELVTPGDNGELFESGNALALVAAARKVLGTAELLTAYSEGATRAYTARHTAAANLSSLEQIYTDAVEEAQKATKLRIATSA